MARVHVIGSGISGLCCAYELQHAGCDVSLTTASNGPDHDCCSWWAGGMLAPFCEQESAEPLIGKLGDESMGFWRAIAESSELDYVANGTLVVAAPRDQSLLRTFAAQTSEHKWLTQADISQREPDLRHFQRGLFYTSEAHIEPRLALKILWQKLAEMGVKLEAGRYLSDEEMRAYEQDFDWQIDCRGLAAKDSLEDLRGVKGEMLHIYSKEVQLTGTVRLLHPRYPLYVVCLLYTSPSPRDS